MDRHYTGEDITVNEDLTEYSKRDVDNLLVRVHEGNKNVGGILATYKCYGVVGFLKLELDVLLILITERKRVGSVCGHDVFEVQSTMSLEIHNLGERPRESLSNDGRYKKLLSSMDFSRGFFFSLTYSLMHSLQSNLQRSCMSDPFANRFVWNSYLSHCIQVRRVTS